jgi:hypothetical protein
MRSGSTRSVNLLLEQPIDDRLAAAIECFTAIRHLEIVLRFARDLACGRTAIHEGRSSKDRADLCNL